MNPDTEFYYLFLREELGVLPNVKARKVFGHDGFAVGTCVFAFMAENRLVIRTEAYSAPDAVLPKDLEFFEAIGDGHKWVGIRLTQSLKEIRDHWYLIEESYAAALARERDKRKNPRRSGKKKRGEK
jgi:TfoX/Sxy family transcriptional regulator of competence genes